MTSQCTSCGLPSDRGWTDGEAHDKCALCEIAEALQKEAPRNAAPSYSPTVECTMDDAGRVVLILTPVGAYTAETLVDMLAYAERTRARTRRANRRYEDQHRERRNRDKAAQARTRREARRAE